MEAPIEQTRGRFTSLSSILGHLDFEGPFTVMDVGPGMSGTVSFFNQFSCRLYFLDLFDKPPDAGHVPLKNIPAGERFDVCLLWDYLNFLDKEHFTLFVRALRSFIHDETLIHLFVAYSSSLPLRRLRYGVDESGSISLKSDDRALVPHPRSRSEVMSAGPQLTAKRATLLQENALEMLLVNDRR